MALNNNNNLLLHPDFLPVFGTLPLFKNVVIYFEYLYSIYYFIKYLTSI